MEIYTKNAAGCLTACGRCPMSQMTLKNGIERMLKEEVTEVKEVISAQNIRRTRQWWG